MSPHSPHDPDTPDVARLRRDARARAAARPRRPFAGTVVDVLHDGVALRRYTPDAGDPTSGMVFLHGGFGLFGDLELQDGYCRQLAQTLGVVVASVGYRLAPEASLDDSVADALTGLGHLADAGAERLYLCGDSAGGAVAVLAAARSARSAPSAHPASGLLLTNPNLDLTLRSYDARPGGPGRELSAYAFRAWSRVTDLADAPRLHRSAAGLPPTLLAVGLLDSLAPEAEALAEACRRDGVDHRLVELPGVGHGFAGTEHVVGVLAEARRFFGLG